MGKYSIYFTGVEEKPVRKLLGAPETCDGTGAAEAEVEKEVLVEWDLKRETVGLVFDTTSSNTGAEHGAVGDLA